MAAYYPPSYGGLDGGDLTAKLETAYRRRQQREVVRWLAALRPDRGRLLDAGCGAGDLLAALRADGWSVAGVEPSPDAAALARRRYRLAVATGRLEDAPLQGPFDVVTLAGVLEHLHDPAGAMSRAAGSLAPGGLVAVLFLPRFDSAEARRFGARWLALDLPRHLTHFDESSFARMAKRAGLCIVHREPYSRRHSAAQLVGSIAPGLQKHRFYIEETRGDAAHRGGSAAAMLAPLARRAAFLALVTAARPWCLWEAARGREASCSYFLEPTR
jgi:SAM-dependent methyltransferase